MIKIKSVKTTDNHFPAVYVLDNKKQVEDLDITGDKIKYAQNILKDAEKTFVEIKNISHTIFIIINNFKKSREIQYENLRVNGNKVFASVSEAKFSKLNIVDKSSHKLSWYVLEGLLLSSYKFSKYFKDKEKKNKIYPEQIFVLSETFSSRDLSYMEACISGVFYARDIVNEPLSYMSAKVLSEHIKKIGTECGYQTEIFDKKRIEALKMGGILAVNRGSVDPPTFSILSWDPENAINSQAYVLVGKGLVYDTGGINLKPGSGLDTMKSDKAGAAAVIGLMAAVAKASIPLKITALIPATDNRPGNNAYVPQDIIKMFDGTTVEVLNTDAEGRMILADALAYAKQYKPKLVIDLATLTGAAVVAVGTKASAVMGNDNANIKKIIKSGFDTYERLVELPLWEDFKEQLKSDFADINNIGGRWAGAITAGKFLEHFTDYKWIHLDIAGPAYNEKKTSYHGVGGSGVGVRLLFNFFVNQTLKK